jgi:hypothetical protein
VCRTKTCKRTLQVGRTAPSNYRRSTVHLPSNLPSNYRPIYRPITIGLPTNLRRRTSLTPPRSLKQPEFDETFVFGAESKLGCAPPSLPRVFPPWGQAAVGVLAPLASPLATGR